MKGNGALDFEATIDTATFNAMCDEMVRRIKGTTDTAVKEAEKMDDAFRKVSMAITGYLSFSFAKKMVTELTTVRGEFQQLEIAFETILKNKAKSDKLMREITEFAAKTPFDMKQVATGAKQLLAYGESSEDVIGTMKRLGDIASGLSIPFGDLVYLYGTTRTQGKMMTKDLMQFAGRGVPIIEELAQVFSVSKARILEMASEGKLGFEELQKVVENLTSATGMFGGMMDKQAESLPGLISNLGDAWDQMLNNIGTSTQGITSNAIKMATSIVENYERVVDILKVVAITYGTYKAAVLLQTVAVNGYGKALGLVIAKEKILSVIQKSNPWGLALAGITAVVSALILFNKSQEESISLQEQISSEVEDRTGKEQKALDSLFATLKRTNSTQHEKAEAIRVINDKYAPYLKNMLTEKSTAEDIAKAYDTINMKLKDYVEISVRKDKAMSLSKEVDDLQKEWNRVRNMTGKEYAKEIGVIEGVKGVSRKNELSRLLTEYTNKNIEYNRVLAEIQDIINSQTVKTDPEEPDPENGKPTKKTFEQKLADIKKQYENYYKWIEHYGKESADLQFKELIKGGDSYLAYLNKQIALLERKKISGESDNLVTLLSSKDEVTGVKSRMDALKEETQKAKDSYKSLADYIVYLDEQIAKEKAKNDSGEQSLQMLQYLQEQRNASEQDYLDQSLGTYNQLLQGSKKIADRKQVIENQYNETVKKLDKKSLGEKYDQAVQMAKDIKEASLKEIYEEKVMQSEAYKKLSGDVEHLTRSAIKVYTRELEKQLWTLDKQSEAYANVESAIKDAKNTLKSMDAKAFSVMSDGFGAVADMVADFNSQLSASLDLAGNLAGAIGQIASGDIAGGIIAGGTALWNYISNIGERRKAEDEEQHRVRMEMLNRYVDRLTESLELQKQLLEDLVGTDRIKQFASTFETLAANISQVSDKLREMKVVYSYATGGGRNNGVRHEIGNLSISDVDLKLDGLTNTYDKIQKIQSAMSTLNGDIETIRKKIDAGQIEKSEDLDLMLQEYKNYVDELQEIQNQFFAEVTGTTYDSVVDSLVSAFENGLTSAQFFADGFEDMMRKALLQSLSINALQKPLQDWYTLFAQLSEDGLTKEEIKELRESMKEIWANGEESAKLIEEASGMSLSNSEALANADKLSSAIKGVTEQTASIIAGQMNAIRMNQATAVQLMNKKLTVLNQIEINTRFMKLIYEHLKNSRTGPILASTRING